MLLSEGLAKKYENGQFNVTEAGRQYLNPVQSESADKKSATKQKPASGMDALLKEETSLPATKKEQLAETAVFTVEANQPVVPDAIDQSLVDLAKKLRSKQPEPVKNVALKIAVLQRIGALLDPSISEVLSEIAADLQNQQVAA